MSSPEDFPMPLVATGGEVGTVWLRVGAGVMVLGMAIPTWGKERVEGVGSTDAGLPGPE